MAAAKKEWSADLFTHPYTAQYGSVCDPVKVKDLRTGKVTTVGQRDVWRITISGLNPPRPSGLASNGIRTFVIYVDDKTGKVLMAEG